MKLIGGTVRLIAMRVIAQMSLPLDIWNGIMQVKLDDPSCANHATLAELLAGLLSEEMSFHCSHPNSRVLYRMASTPSCHRHNKLAGPKCPVGWGVVSRAI